jgi:polar amino acid transport system substrate-binding protein
MKKLYALSMLVVAAMIMLTACGPAATAEPADLLAEIKQRGYILISTDPNYEPQSFLNTEGSRPADTKCPGDVLTPAEMQGFDVDVAKKIGDGLGVETCFATPDWDMITGGNWADKWDISVGSMTITTERLKVLDFTTPYYYTPAVVAAAADAGIASLEDLAGKAVCAGTSTTYESWLNNDMEALGLPESSIYAHAPEGITVVPLGTDQDCAQSIGAGRTDFLAYVTSETVVDSNIANGLAVVKVGTPVYSEDLAVSVDKNHTLPIDTLMVELNKIVQGLHDDGTLSQLSTQWFGADLTQSPTK